MKKNLIAGLCALGTILTIASPAFAVDVPGSADPSRISNDLLRQKRTPLATNEPLIQQEQQETAQQAQSVRFTLNSVAVEGNTVFKNGEIEALYNGKIGQEVTLAEMYEIRDGITRLYREKGYILSRAIVPAQKLGKGKADFKFRIIEGFINDVQVQGEIKGDRKLIEHYIAQLKKAGPVNSNEMERYLLLINDLPGTEATAVLRPATNASGGSDIIINLTHDYVSGVVLFDNSGSKFIGEYLASGEVNVNSALGMSEQITARLIATPGTEELLFGDISYLQPIGYEGTEIRANYGRTETRPGSTLEPLDIEGATNHYELEVTHPFLRTRKENLSGRVNFSVENTDTTSGGLDVYNDKTRVLTIGGTYDLADAYKGINLIDLSVSQGLDVFDATNNSDLKSRGNGDSTFTKFNLEASRLQQIENNIAVLFSTEAQYSLDALLAGEEFGIGGSEFARGYNFSEVTGDHGVAAKIELQFGVDAGYDHWQGMQLYTFYDIGRVWQADRLAGEDSHTSLSSVGFGSRLTFTDSVGGYAEISKPLNKKISAEGDRDVQFHFGLNYLF